MILPPHITKQDKKDIATLFYHVKKTEGINEALLLKKMATVAAFGTMIRGKIDFKYFVQCLQKHIYEDKCPKPITEFWHIKERSTLTKEKMFLIPYELVYNGTQQQVEIAIGELFTKMGCYKIKEEHKQYFNQSFKK